jgi:hypothetical protein
MNLITFFVIIGILLVIFLAGGILFVLFSAIGSGTRPATKPKNPTDFTGGDHV